MKPYGIMVAISIVVIFTLTALLSMTLAPPEANRLNLSSYAEVDPFHLIERDIEEEEVYILGFDRRLEIKEDVRMYTNLLGYLQAKTGYKFRIHVTPKDQSVIEEIGSGVVDFAVTGMGSYIQVKHKYGATILAHGKTTVDDTVGEYRAVIFTKPNSSIKNLRDLRLKTMAFGPRSSTQGHLIPRIMLQEKGLTINDLADYGYMDSHSSTVNAVLSSRYDAGAIQDQLGQRLEAQGLIKIIAESDYYPSSGVIAGKHVEPIVVEAVTKALLDCDPNGIDQHFFSDWERSEMRYGFLPTRDNSYKKLEEIALNIGLVE
ncbi:PhnD/SsuA/transferrin family substrate-binding protein [Desulfuribacillus stibiiarsenatis]|nr:PhnD/SsuA/transferrin family substrate-binding protein [Desulfuribacillus stibiiarsenatis]